MEDVGILHRNNKTRRQDKNKVSSILSFSVPNNITHTHSQSVTLLVKSRYHWHKRLLKTNHVTSCAYVVLSSKTEHKYTKDPRQPP